jgi:exodeoxyribonuclease VII large subunit
MDPITVSKLTSHIVALFEGNDTLRDVWVSGEVSNWKRAASGHVYFRLKDSGATINAVMWKGAAQAQSWLPREGDQVLAHGYVGVYPEGGAYQLYVNMLRPAGRGQLYAQYEELKARLQAAGLFDAGRKQPMPLAPARIGIVTSPDAAALRDILRVLSARWPMLEVIVFPTLVQGSEAPAQIANAIAAANHYHVAVSPIDTLIVGRGGGSIEDLWGFNDERVAYAIANSVLPIVSGVGHETDFTIADFVADLRAPTPSAAAAAATPDRAELIGQLAALKRRMIQQATGRLQQERRHLAQTETRLRRVHPRRQLDTQVQRLDDRTRRLHSIMHRRLERLSDRRLATSQRLESLNPLRVLQRGYSIVQRQDGVVVMGSDGASRGDLLRVRAATGDYTVQKVS